MRLEDDYPRCIQRGPHHPWALCGEDALASSVTRAESINCKNVCVHCLAVMEQTKNEI